MTKLDYGHNEHQPTDRMTKVGAALGWIGVGWGCFVGYRAISVPLKVARFNPSGTVVNLSGPLIGIYFLSQIGIVTNAVLALLCVALQRGRLRSWILAAVGMAIAFTISPLANYVLRRVIARHGLVVGGE
ncbi:MAG TPA: hypothetical protein VHS31_01335 [Tepidisphaeraceae bacterium]|nr:hypothetical protein [Tepidisphaeraceae bacterium]